MQLDYIPIHKGEMLPTKDMGFHTRGELPKGITNKEDFKKRMIEEALHSNYLRGCDCVIIMEEGQVIGIEVR